MMRFNLDRIAASLRAFQADFDSVNARLSLHREPFTDDLLANLLTAYEFLNRALVRGFHIMTPAGQHTLLEMNHLVLCGADPRTRFEYHNHVLETRARFQKRIGTMRDWFRKRQHKDDAFTLASVLYSRAVSQPQLFLEGNHRTGNLLVNFVLVSAGKPPFVVRSENAIEYFELSGAMKLSGGEGKLRAKRGQVSRWRRQFADLLRSEVDTAYLSGRDDQ
jgi:hypothetical protein